jgi:hypothetical protein
MATIAQRKAGWQVQVRRHGFKPRSKHFKTSADAKSWARTIEAEMDRGVLVDRSHAEQTTLAEILQRYRKTVTTLKRGKKQEESRINVVSAHPVACQTLATLRAADFAAYRDDRLQQVSGTTVNKELNLFANVIDTARRNGRSTSKTLFDLLSETHMHRIRYLRNGSVLRSKTILREAD